jgi:membrane protein
MGFHLHIRGRAVDSGRLLAKAWDDIQKNHTMSLAAGLSYYFVLSLFPLLILASAVVGYLPFFPNLFSTLLDTMSRIVPADSMRLVNKVLQSVINSHRGGFLTIGILGTLWTASSGVSALIEALNVAYDVPETRPFWKTRPLAIGLTLVLGALLITALGLMIVGPSFGEWLARKAHVSWTMAHAWPFIRWGATIGFVVLAVEILFFIAPNVKQRFWATLPGALIGVGFWIASSWALGYYFQHFANFNATYGVLGGAIALMVWLYWSSFAILAGAEINSELLKASGAGKLEIKEKPPAVVKPRPAWEDEHGRPAA